MCVNGEWEVVFIFWKLRGWPKGVGLSTSLPKLPEVRKEKLRCEGQGDDYNN